MEKGTKEYYEELEKRYNEGGSIWLIENANGEYFLPSIMMQTSNDFSIPLPEWSSDLKWCALFGYLTKEDAEKDYIRELSQWTKSCSNPECPHEQFGYIEKSFYKIVEHVFVTK